MSAFQGIMNKLKKCHIGFGCKEVIVKALKEHEKEKENSEYTKKANEFLTKYGLEIKIILTDDQSKPDWTENDTYGFKYYSELMKNGISYGKFPFWNCYLYKEPALFVENKNNLHSTMLYKMIYTSTIPSAYDILVCLSFDYYTIFHSFSDWCVEFGYNKDSIKDKNTYEKSCDISRALGKWLPDNEECINEFLDIN